MQFFSVRDRQDLIEPFLNSLGNHWPACKPWIGKHIGLCLMTKGSLPETIIATKHDEIVGGYTLDEKWIEEAGERGLWMPTLYIDPKFRRRNYSPKIIEHARKLSGKLGYEKIFLTSEHVNNPA